MKHRFLLTVLFSMVAAGAFPQTSTDRPPGPRLRIGPLEVFPLLALTNLGVDTNVFNEPDQAAPKSDFTLTLTPGADLRMRLGRSRLTGVFKEDLVYYQTYANQRAANTHFNAGAQVPLNRVTVNGGVSYLDTRERPGFEIDTRSQRNELGADGLVEVRTLPKTFVGLRGSWTKVDYDEDATFLGSSLQTQLNRTMTTAAVTTRYRLTPLTDLLFDVSVEQDRFEFSPLRDSDSIRITGGVKFQPRALLKGTASFGYRDFQPTSSDLAPFQGAVGAVDLALALGPTRLGLQADRDVQYSYDVNQPYYLQNGVLGSVVQHVFGPVDLSARLGVARLDYQNRVTSPLPDRSDYTHTYGGSVVYRLARGTRMAFNVDQSRRTSTRELREYHGLRYGMSVIYGN